MLTTQFEELRMQVDETIVVFRGKLRDIENKAFQLGEKYLEEQLVRKDLRSLATRYYPKVATIEEAKDVPKLALDDLLNRFSTNL